jgi:lysozyme
MITNLAEQLNRDEDLRLFVYDDATGMAIKPGSYVKGNPTVGIGRSLNIDGLSKPEAMFLLANDIARIMGELEQHFPWAAALDDARRGVLLNMIFEMGRTRRVQTIFGRGTEGALGIGDHLPARFHLGQD